MSWCEKTQGTKKGHQTEKGYSRGWLRGIWLEGNMTLRGHSVYDKHLPQTEGQRLSDFYHHLSQKSCLFSNSHKKQVPALAHSSMDGKHTPDSAAQQRGGSFCCSMCRWWQPAARAWQIVFCARNRSTAKGTQLLMANALWMLVEAKARLFAQVPCF